MCRYLRSAATLESEWPKNSFNLVRYESHRSLSPVHASMPDKERSAPCFTSNVVNCGASLRRVRSPSFQLQILSLASMLALLRPENCPFHTKNKSWRIGQQPTSTSNLVSESTLRTCRLLSSDMAAMSSHDRFSTCSLCILVRPCKRWTSPTVLRHRAQSSTIGGSIVARVRSNSGVKASPRNRALPSDASLTTNPELGSSIVWFIVWCAPQDWFGRLNPRLPMSGVRSDRTALRHHSRRADRRLRSLAPG